MYAGTLGARRSDRAREEAASVQLNPVNGIAELIGETMPAEAPTVQAESARVGGRPAKAPAVPPFLESQFNYSLADLVDEFGFR